MCRSPQAARRVLLIGARPDSLPVMDAGWKRLGRSIAAERARRDWTVQDLATRSHVGRRTIQHIEAGTHPGVPRATTVGRIEKAFDWREGSAERIREGAYARREQDPLLARLQEGWTSLSTDEQVVIVTVVETLIRQR